MDLELRLLRSLVAIYETHSLSKAAERLNCTQAAMSLRLKMLEEEVGDRLFKRMHHNLEPTSQCSSLYAKALVVLAAYDEMMSVTRSKTRMTRIRIGVPDDYSIGIMTRAFEKLRKLLPGYEIEIHCDLSANLVAALHRQDLDLALASLASPPAQDHMVVHARLYWVAARDFQRDLNQPLALSAYPEGCVFRRRMITALEEAGLPWRILTQSRSHAGILSSVRAGLAVTLMAEGTLPADLAPLNPAEALPDVGMTPIYLVRSETASGPAIASVEKAIIECLEAAYGRVAPAPALLARHLK